MCSIYEINSIYLTYGVLDLFCIQEAYLLQNVSIRKGKRTSGRSLKVAVLIENVIRMAEFDKHIILSDGLWGHFALGSSSETYLKDIVFVINVFIKTNHQQ